jgi:hypothetical protein
MKNLFLQYWESPCEERNKEVIDCILTNISSNFFDNIFIFTNNIFPVHLSKNNTKIIISKSDCNFNIAFTY